MIPLNFIIDNKVIKMCCYCNHAIDQTTDGWGMTEVDYGVRYWHEECFELYEDIII